MGLESSINASDLFRDKVFCSESEKIGEVVNIIFHPELHDGRLLYFLRNSPALIYGVSLALVSK